MVILQRQSTCLLLILQRTPTQLQYTGKNFQSRKMITTSLNVQKSSVLHRVYDELKLRFAKNTDKNSEFQLLTPSQRDHFLKKNEKMPHRRKAAVLVLIASVGGEPSLIFTERASHLEQHAAEISFPGGHFDSTMDKDLEETALREAQEELRPLQGFIKETVELLGEATPLPSIKGTPVTPLIGVCWRELPDPVAEVFPGDPSEVAHVFSMSIKDLAQCETSHNLPSNRFGSVRAPMFPSIRGNIWGLTAYITRPVLHRLLIPVFQPGKSSDSLR